MTLFSVPALLIMFREALEAAVVVAVLLQMVDRMKMPQLKKHVWIGALAGVGLSIIIGVVFILLFYVAGEKIFTGNSQSIFKGVVSWIASLLITMVAFHMLKFYNMERKWQRKLAAAMEEERSATARSSRYSIMLLAFMATLREGIESVLFLTGVSQGAGVKSLIIPGIVGVICGLALGMLLFYSGRGIKSLKWFFILSCGLLLLVGAGLVVQGVVFFTSAGLFGTTFPYEYAPYHNHILWDTSGCCDMYSNQFWSLIRAVFGYTDQPTVINLVFYILYWVLVLGLLAYKAWTGNLTDKHKAEIEDLKSFTRHAQEHLDAEQGLDGKSQGSGSGDLDLEAGEGKPPKAADSPPSPDVLRSSLEAPLPNSQLVGAQLGAHPVRHSLDDSVESVGKPSSSSEEEAAGPPPATASLV